MSMSDSCRPAPEALTREQIRSRRKREIRKATLAERNGKLEVRRLGMLVPKLTHEEEAMRPATRRDCADGIRPCPWVSCKHHLFLDVNPQTGGLILNFPDIEPEQLAETCSLDVADQGGETLEAVGELMNVTRERVRQVEARALWRLSKRGLRSLREFAPEGPLEPVRKHDSGDDE
jgi:hypothetical protein